MLSALADVATSLQLALYLSEDMEDMQKKLDNLSESELLALLAEGGADE